MDVTRKYQKRSVASLEEELDEFSELIKEVKGELKVEDGYSSAELEGPSGDLNEKESHQELNGKDR